jgi:hypothetical protein
VAAARRSLELVGITGGEDQPPARIVGSRKRQVLVSLTNADRQRREKSAHAILWTARLHHGGVPPATDRSRRTQWRRVDADQGVFRKCLVVDAVTCERVSLRCPVHISLLTAKEQGIRRFAQFLPAMIRVYALGSEALRLFDQEIP